jgi:3-oxoacyl-[acyl-carrier protein] reductase
MRLKDRVALITGGSRGLGRATAERMAAEGAAVAINYNQNAAAADELAKSIRAADGRAITIRADVANEDDVRAMVETAAAEWGRLDILVNNAGIYIGGRLTEVTSSELETITATNVHSVLYASQAAAPHMIRGGWGRIINLSSLSGIGTGTDATSVYALSKAAVIMMTKRFAFELGSHGITVNAIAPGVIETDMARECLRSQASEDEARQALIASTILGRTGLPGEVAGAALFLASEDAAFITAHTLVVDGGRTNFLSHSG